MNNKDMGLANIGIGVCGCVLGLVELINPPTTRPTGRWSLIFGPLFDSFGPSGPAMTWFAVGVALIVFGTFLWSKK